MIMKRREILPGFLAVILLVSSLIPVFCQDKKETAKMNGWREEFLISVWNAPKTAAPDACAKALAGMDFNVAMWDPGKLDVCQEYGLKVLARIKDLEQAAGLACHPALWGYFLDDEPYPESTFPPLARKVGALHEIDPHHPGFINVLSTTGVFLRTYMAIVKPELLSYDYYQWSWGSYRYFEKLEQFRETALAAGIPLFVCIEATANPRGGEGPPDNAQKLRQSVYTSLAYGVKGVQWYDYSVMFKENSVQLNRNGKDIAALNREIKTIGPVLIKLRSLGVFHTPPLPKGTREAPVEHWVRLIAGENTGGLVLGMFTDDSRTGCPDDVNIDYMMVANRDYRNSQNVVVIFQSQWLGVPPWHTKKKEKRSVDQLDKKTGKWKQISSGAGSGFVFYIQPADGELFRITSKITMEDEADAAARLLF
jgi:hypothetical protein